MLSKYLLVVTRGVICLHVSCRYAWSLDRLNFISDVFFLITSKVNFIALLFQTVVSCPVAPSMVLPAVDWLPQGHATIVFYMRWFSVLISKCKQICHHARNIRYYKTNAVRNYEINKTIWDMTWHWDITNIKLWRNAQSNWNANWAINLLFCPFSTFMSFGHLRFIILQ